MTPATEPNSASISPQVTGIGGNVHAYLWTWKKSQFQVIYETLGEGVPILLLPAFSTVSSRAEMRGLAEKLATDFQVIAVDWPGFGSSDRHRVNYEPALYHRFLADFMRDNFRQPVVVIAAGHAAGYVMKLAAQQPPVWSWVVLVAPTWRGPLPTMKEMRWFYKLVKRLIYLPIIGPFCYFFATRPAFLRFMYRRHVFANAELLTKEFIQQKYQTTQTSGARFAPVSFVTGTLDSVKKRPEFIELFQPLPVPTLVIVGEQTPPKSRMEMEVLVSFCGVQKTWLPGSLGLHEEHPDTIVNTILPFLKKFLSHKKEPTYLEEELNDKQWTEVNSDE